VSKYIYVEYYEFSLGTRNKRQTQELPPPPIENVDIKKAFTLLSSQLSAITSAYVFDNGNFSTTIEFINVGQDRINLVFGYYDGLAPHRTLKHKTSGAYNIQKRTEQESVKYLCHCVIKLDPQDCILSKIGVEKVTGMPVSILIKTLNHYFKQLERLAPNSEDVFQVTNPDNANNPDGTPDVHKFILKAKFYPIAGEMLTDAILSGRLNKIRLNGRRTTNFDDPNRRLTYLKGTLDFAVTPLQPNDTPQSYLRSLIDTATRNKFQLTDVKTYAIIENDNQSEQPISLNDGDLLNSAFVLKRKFDPTQGRVVYPDNTQINQMYLDEIWRLF